MARNRSSSRLSSVCPTRRSQSIRKPANPSSESSPAASHCLSRLAVTTVAAQPVVAVDYSRMQALLGADRMPQLIANLLQDNDVVFDIQEHILVVRPVSAVQSCVNGVECIREFHYGNLYAVALGIVKP